MINNSTQFVSPSYYEDNLPLPKVGDVVNGYKLSKLIQNTNNSLIYSANNTNNGQNVAIKFIKYREKCHSRVDNEVRLATQVDSPFIISALEHFDYAQYRCIVMPLARSDVHQLINPSNPQRIPEEQVKQMMFSALLGLKYLHDRNICHRDIKLENLLLMSENVNNIQITDLGFAQEAKNGEKFTEYLGTLMYAAPEVISGTPYDLSCDIWSMGVTLFTLLCGEFPFPTSNDALTKQSIRSGSFFFRNNLWKDISKEAKDLVTQMLKKNPKARYTVDQCLSHPWFKGMSIPNRQSPPQ